MSDTVLGAGQRGEQNRRGAPSLGSQCREGTDLGHVLTLETVWRHTGPRAWKERNMVLGKRRAEKLVWMVAAM